MEIPWAEACAIPVAADGAPLASCQFDQSEELIWSVSGSGMIYSHIVPTVEPYTAFRMDNEPTASPPVGIFPNPYGLIALAHDGVHFFTKGGLRQADVRLDSLQGVTCGCLIASTSSTRLGVVASAEPDTPRLLLLDLGTAAVTTSIDIDSAATLARYEPRSSLLCLSGADGVVSTYDLRAGAAKAAGRCVLYPSKASVICDMDVAGSAICTSALRSQLGPLGTSEYVFDTTLRSLDMRTMRPTADVHCAEGAMRLKWFFGGGHAPQLLAATAEGNLHLLEARGSYTAPSTLALSLGARAEQLCALDVSATEQMICVGGSSGSLTIGANGTVSPDALQANPYAQPPELPEPFDENLPMLQYDPPRGAPPVPTNTGAVPAPPARDEAPLASAWPASLLGRKGRRTVDPEAYVRSLGLPSSYAALGSTYAPPATSHPATP